MLSHLALRAHLSARKYNLAAKSGGRLNDIDECAIIKDNGFSRGGMWQNRTGENFAAF